MQKTNRIWSQRSEAIAILAANPDMTGEALACALFNSKPEVLAKDVETHRARLAAEIKARREKEDKVLATQASKEEAKGETTSAAQPVAEKTKKQA